MSANTPFIFVVMPFQSEFDKVYSNLQMIAGMLGATTKRADAAEREAKQISEQIVRFTRKADLIVADISLLSPNVYYEIGYAQALGKPVLLIARDLSTVAFDVRNYQIIAYGDNLAIRDFSNIVSPHLQSMLDDAVRDTALRQPIMDTLDYIDSMDPPHNDLFSEIMGAYIEEMRERAHQWSTGRVYVGREEAIKKGIEVFKRLRKGGFVTFLVKINEFWNSTDTYAQECRAAASRSGIAIDRVFVTPDVDSLFNPLLRERIDLDERSGVKTYIALSRGVEPDAVHDFGIWDNEVLCLIETNPVRPNEVNGATFSRLPNELSSARTWEGKIRARSVSAPTFLKRIDELSQSNEHLAMLLRSADYMADQARHLCHGSYLASDDCRWYHQAWQYLRIVDMVSTPDRHSEFYQATLRDAIEHDDSVNVLISGSADYGILQQIFTATPSDKSKRLNVYVSDICETPLRICDWYARTIRRPGQAMPRLIPSVEDMLATRFTDSMFDVIVTDAFLTRFTSDDKAKVVKEWNRILKPGGVVITTSRISNGVRPDIRGSINSHPEEIKDFANRAVLAAQSLGNWFPIGLSDLHSCATAYAQKITSYPFLDEQALKTVFTSNGFQIRRISLNTVKGEFHPSTQYGQICAEKPTRDRP